MLDNILLLRLYSQLFLSVFELFFRYEKFQGFQTNLVERAYNLFELSGFKKLLCEISQAVDLSRTHRVIMCPFIPDIFDAK